MTVLLVLATSLGCGGALRPPLAPPLEGHWQVVGWTLPGAAPVPAALPALSFAVNAVTGVAGCNRLSGRVTFETGRVTFSVLNTSRMSCGPAVNAQEAALMKFLSGQTVGYERRGNRLVFHASPDGPRLTVRRTFPPAP